MISLPSYEDIERWFDENATSKITFYITNNGVSIQGSMTLNVGVKNIPFKISFASSIHAFLGLTTLENFPDKMGGLRLSGCGISSLKYLPQKMITLSVHTCKQLKDPYEFRYILFSNISNLELETDTEIEEIILKYYGKPDLAHIAIEELMNLGEARGFTYE